MFIFITIGDLPCCREGVRIGLNNAERGMYERGAIFSIEYSVSEDAGALFLNEQIYAVL